MSKRQEQVNAPTSAELARLTQTLARRIGRYLERQERIRTREARSEGQGPWMDLVNRQSCRFTIARLAALVPTPRVNLTRLDARHPRRAPCVRPNSLPVFATGSLLSGAREWRRRAVDQDGEIIDVFLQPRRDGKAAKRFFKRLLKTHRHEPRKIMTDKLRSYGVAHRELAPEAFHDTSQYANNRAEFSHQPTRVRERAMRRSKSAEQCQRFLSVRAVIQNLFNLGRHLISAKHYRDFQTRAFASWERAVA